MDLSTKPGVKEMVVTAYEDQSGQKGVITSMIHRVGPISFLGKAEKTKEWMETIYYFDPIRRAWSDRSQQSGSLTEEE